MGLILKHLDLIFLSLFFWALFLTSVLNKTLFWEKRLKIEKIIDVWGLFTQGVLVPVFSFFLSAFFLRLLLPSLENSIGGFSFITFLFPFLIVDYLYYWNHRLFHSNKMWFLHRVHHTPKVLDILVTSRNSLWTPFFLVYLWVQSFFVYVLADPFPYLMGAALSGGLDLWRHSFIKLPNGFNIFRSILIFPEDHQWHHSSTKTNVNFGANLNIWDRFHGTFYRPSKKPINFGIESRGSWFDWAFTPWRLK